MTLKEIKKAVSEGRRVYCGNKGYEVMDGGKAGLLINCTANGYAIGLTHADGVTMNGKPSEFFTEEPKEGLIDIVRGMNDHAAKHTPGLWTVATGWIKGPQGQQIVKYGLSAWDKEGVKEAEANAALIAAAPELLAALEWATKNIEEIALPEMEKQGRVTSLNNALERARAAIAKAKGK